MEDLCDRHDYYRRTQSIIGDGAEGYIHQACDKYQMKRILADKDLSPCGHVVKEIRIDSPVLIDEMAGLLEIGPRAMIIPCPAHRPKPVVYLIQERLDMTLKEYIETHRLTQQDLKALSRLVYDSIDKLKIFHNDLHHENIMLTPSKKFRLIDFTTAVSIDSIGWRTFDRLLKRHRFIEFGAGEPIKILSDDQYDKLLKSYRPTDEYSKDELTARTRRQELIRTAREEATRALQKRLTKKTLK